MRRALVPVLIAVLATPLVAAAAPGPAVEAPRATDPVPVVEDAPRMLTVGTVAAEGYNDTRLDWSAAFGSDATALHATFLQYELRERLRRADGEATRRAVFDRAVERVADRLSTLRDRERTAVRAFASGSIGERSLLARLGTVHAEAEALEPTIEMLVDVAPDDERVRRAFTQGHRAASMTGPLRADLAAGLEGEPGAKVHVEASGDGVTMARVVESDDGPTYVRETVRFDNLDGGGNTTFASANDLPDYLTERYPWASANSVSLSIEFPGAVHQFELNHQAGTLEGFVDGSSRRIFRETHRMEATQVPVSGTENASGTTLRVAVNRTFPGGPLRVGVTDEIGETRNATVTVGDRAVGATGDDGVLWAVAPNGAANVTVTAAGDAVSVPLRP